MWPYKTLGIPDDLFIQSEMVPGPTKEEVRAITLSKARLFDGSVVVDVGCGTGGLTVEASLQVGSKGKVFAYDENKEAVDLTKVNVSKLGEPSVVQVQLGKAPDVLAVLPSVNAVFIGGSHSLREVIRSSYEKLTSNGRIVINAIQLETAFEALDEVKKQPFTDVDVVLVSVAKGKTVSSGTMLLARNPITIISATKG